MKITAQTTATVDQYSIEINTINIEIDEDKLPILRGVEGNYEMHQQIMQLGQDQGWIVVLGDA